MRNGSPELTERILAAIPGTGVATRILNFAPGTDTTPNGVQVHDFWEEVYILKGSMTDTRLGETFTAAHVRLPAARNATRPVDDRGRLPDV